jgi:hypothetical protein
MNVLNYEKLNDAIDFAKLEESRLKSQIMRLARKLRFTSLS